MPTFSLFWTFPLFFLLLPVWAQLPSCLRPYGATILWGRWEGRPKSRPALHSYPDAAPPALVSRWYLLSAVFWLLSISLTLWQCIRAQPQAPVGLISSCIRCHLMSSSPYSSQLYLPWCFFDVSSLISYQTAPAKVPAQGGSLGRLRCHGCYTLFSHCCRNHCWGGTDWGPCSVHSRFLTSSLPQSASTCGLFTVLCTFVIWAEMLSWTPLSTDFLPFTTVSNPVCWEAETFFIWSEKSNKHCLGAI